jgi:membrane-bound ClpP family serine protease
MLDVSSADLVFSGSLAIGGGLLLLTLILDDLFGGLLGALHLGFDVTGVSPTPMLLGFVAMFGLGGLLGEHGLGLNTGLSTLLGVGMGALGAGVVFGAFKALKNQESSTTFSLQDMIGSQGRVAIGIPAQHFGSVFVSFQGSSHNLTATADTDIAAGKTVKIIGVTGPNLVVALEE